jgi:hypothetical protein
MRTWSPTTAKLSDTGVYQQTVAGPSMNWRRVQRSLNAYCQLFD